MFNAKSLALWAAVLLAATNAAPAPCKPCNNGPRPQIDASTGSLPFSQPVPLPEAGAPAVNVSSIASDTNFIGNLSSIPIIGGPLESLRDYFESLGKIANPLATLEGNASGDASIVSQ
ncbi:hypothetical protein DFP73DRAFT_634927 [Morchella snyderi]|nr:hypothetical protein DFP73DRAFT_634927 [Morchella snyderi]